MTAALTGKEDCPCGSERRTCRECGKCDGDSKRDVCPESEHKCADCGVTCEGHCGGQECSGESEEEGVAKPECSCGGGCGDGCGEGETCKCHEGEACGCHKATTKHVAIAIDGPAGAGKTTTAKEVAARLGYVYVDTGALYRAFAVHKLWLSKEAAEKEPGSAPVTNQTALRTFDLEFAYENGEQVMLLWGENINPYLRTEEVSMESSNVGTDPDVRAALLELQRRQALAYDVVMEGRDIGTVVLPDAQVKIFLTASLTARSTRRFKALLDAGESADYCTVMEQLCVRDWQDSTRAIAPLKPACDAVQLDNTELSFEATVEKVLSVVKAKLG